MRAGAERRSIRMLWPGAKFLQSLPTVDPKKIGLWGGSYGGYLTALGLARNSDLFAAGVDMHGVHDWSVFLPRWENRPGAPDAKEAEKLAFDSSPDAAVSSWKSPVLLIHGDDDRNVPFGQTVDLAQRLREQHVVFEELIFPDEIHDFLMWKDWIKAYTATADFFDRNLKREHAGDDHRKLTGFRQRLLHLAGSQRRSNYVPRSRTQSLKRPSRERLPTASLARYRRVQGQHAAPQVLLALACFQPIVSWASTRESYPLPFQALRHRFLWRQRAPIGPGEIRRIERWLATARVFLAVSALVAIRMDPGEVGYSFWAYGLLAFYIAQGVIVILLLRRREQSTAAFRRLVHAADIVWPALMSIFATGQANPFFLFFVFVLAAAAYRWGVWETVATAASAVFLLWLESLAFHLGFFAWVDRLLFRFHLPLLRVQPTDFEPKRLFMLSIYLLVMGLLLGYLAEQQKQLRSEKAVIARILGKVRVEAGLSGTLQEIVGELLVMYGAGRGPDCIAGGERSSRVCR